MSLVSYSIQSQGLTGETPPLVQIVVGLAYLDPANTYSTAEWLVLSKAQPTGTWQFDPGTATAGTAFYYGVTVSGTGETTSFGPTAATPGRPITVGSGVPPLYTIAVVPVQVDWTRVDTATVTVANTVFTFTASQTAAGYVALPAQSYSWSVVYRLHDGSTYSVQATQATSPILLLPVLPPLAKVTFAVDPSYFAELQVETISVRVDNPHSTPIPLTLTPGSPGPLPASIFMTPQGDGWTLLYDYDYTVTFQASSGWTPFVAPSATGQTASAVTLTELGVRSFPVVGAVPPFVSQILVTYPFSGASKSVQAPVVLVANNGDYTPGTFDYTLTYVVCGAGAGANVSQTGKYIVLGQSPAPPYVPIPGNPFTQKSVTITAPDLPSNTTFQIGPKTIENGNLGFHGAEWSITGVSQPSQVVVSQAHNSYMFSFMTVDPDQAAFSYAGMMIVKGHSYPMSNALSTATEITLSADQLPFTVTVDPSAVAWTDVTKVTMSLWTETAPTQKTAFTFLPTDGAKYQTYAIGLKEGAPALGYCVTYLQTDGSRTTVKVDGVSTATIYLPANGTGPGSACDG